MQTRRARGAWAGFSGQGRDPPACVAVTGSGERQFPGPSQILSEWVWIGLWNLHFYMRPGPSHGQPGLENVDLV